MTGRLDWIENVMQTIDMSPLEGEIAGYAKTVGANQKQPSFGGNKFDTLDEPISATLARDLRSIFTKVCHIILPIKSDEGKVALLREWDLWGPLILCTFLALVLHHNEDQDGSVGPHFAEIFVLIWFGCLIISLNYKLLALSSLTKHSRKNSGSNRLPVCPSVFQLLCVFGYSLAPAGCGLLLIKIFEIVFVSSPHYYFYAKLLMGFSLGFLLPTISAVSALKAYQDAEKRILATYPVALFYFLLGWLITSAH